jgi:hypothetical protein
MAALAGTAAPRDEPVLPIEAYGYEEPAAVAEAALLPSIDEFTFDEPAAAAAELPPIDAFAYDEPATASAEVDLPSIELFAYDDAAVDAPALVGDVEAAEPELVMPEAVDAEPFAGAGFEAPVIEEEQPAEPAEALDARVGSPLVEVEPIEDAHAPAAPEPATCRSVAGTRGRVGLALRHRDDGRALPAPGVPRRGARRLPPTPRLRPVQPGTE